MTAKPKSWSPWFEKRKFRDPIGDRKRWEAEMAKCEEDIAKRRDDRLKSDMEYREGEERKARMREIKFTASLCVGYVALVFFLWLL